MTEEEMARDYVLKQFKRNKEFRTRLSELYIGKPMENIDAEYLLGVLKTEWRTMGETEKISLAQSVAGAGHYNAFIQAMEK